MTTQHVHELMARVKWFAETNATPSGDTVTAEIVDADEDGRIYAVLPSGLMTSGFAESFQNVRQG